MKKVKRLRFASLVAFLMAVIFGISSFAAFNVRADKSTETQASSDETQEYTRRTSGSAFGEATNEEILNPLEPTGYDAEDEANPYGVKKDVPFLLFEQSELFTLYGQEIKATSIKDVNGFAKTAIYDTRNNTNAENVLGGENWDSRVDINYGDLLGAENLFLA